MSPRSPTLKATLEKAERGFRLRFLDLDLRELLLQAANLVLELALRELGLPQFAW